MKKRSLMLITSVLSISAVVFTLIFSNENNFHMNKMFAKADDVHSITLTNSMLNDVTFENFDVPDNRSDVVIKHDKKFKIVLENGQYILGAVISGDCGGQDVGSSLGDAFTTANNNDNDYSCYNYQIIFGFEKFKSATLGFRINLNGGSASRDVKINCKSRHYDGSGDEAFYNDITTAGYSGVLNEYPGSYYNDYDYRLCNDIGIDTYCDYVLEFNKFDNCNMFVVQFTYLNPEVLTTNQSISFTFNNLTFNYQCL